jgi:hypothetical protein
MRRGVCVTASGEEMRSVCVTAGGEDVRQGIGTVGTPASMRYGVKGDLIRCGRKGAAGELLHVLICMLCRLFCGLLRRLELTVDDDVGVLVETRIGSEYLPHAEGGHETLIRLCGEYRKAANTIRLEKKKRKRAIGLP